MPSKPPSLRPSKISSGRTASNWDKRKTRQQRGYGREHDAMRRQVLAEEPLCRSCRSTGRIAATTVADHIKPKAEGGTDDRDNYQGLCTPCSTAKTAAESGRARRGTPRG